MKWECKNCGKEFHYCSSCDTDIYMDEEYCSKTCWLESYEYETFSNKLSSFWNSLSKKQKEVLFDLWNNGVLNSYLWEPIIDDIFKID